MLAPLVRGESGEFRDVIEKTKREGFVRIRVDGEIVELGRPDPIRLKKGERHTIEAVVDRLVMREGIRSRLADSVETALKWGGNRLVVLRRRELEERETSNACVEATLKRGSSGKKFVIRPTTAIPTPTFR